MDADQKRIAIAEACGYVWYRMPSLTSDARHYRTLFHPAVHEYEGQSPLWLVRADGTEGIANVNYMEREGHLPDYLKDANAMLSAATVLAGRGWRCAAHMGTDGTWECFFTKRGAIVSLPSDGDHYGAGATLTEAMAEAFLRVIGKLE